MKRPCPTCGHPVGRRAKVCDYCGRDLTGGLMNPPTPQSSAGAPSPPIPQPGPFSSPTGIVPGVGRTVRMIIAFLIAAGVIAGAVFLFFFVTKQVQKGIDDVSVVTATPHIGIPTERAGGGKTGGGSKGDSGGGDDDQGFKGARAVFEAMNARHTLCKNFDSVIDTEVVSAATCFAGIEPWTIQVFFDDLSYDAVVSNYKSNDSLHVAYGSNWTVLTQSKESSLKIARALGGRGT